MKGISIGFKGSKSIVLSIVIVACMCFLSCSDEPINQSNTPSISMERIEKIKGVNGKDSLLVIGIAYADGDGDIGLDAHDTFPPFNIGSEFQYNFLIQIQEIKNGNRIPVNQPGTGEPENFNQRIPNLTPTGRNKQISGSIDIRLDATRNYLYPDSIVCQMQLVDRSLHKSNEVQTGIISLSH